MRAEFPFRNHYSEQLRWAFRLDIRTFLQPLSQHLLIVLRISMCPGLGQRYFLTSLVFTLIFSGHSFISGAQILPPSQYQVKAAFLYNFCQFVEWPAKAFPDPGSPMIIGILGQDPFNTYLDELVKNEKVKGHPLVVRRYQSVKEATDCHILFISESQPNRLKHILSFLKGRNILTVGDAQGFTRAGGMIRFFIDQNKIRLEVNPEAAKSAGLTISSKLLRLAEICCEQNN